jgi:broad specificity phosphatase PhoE
MVLPLRVPRPGSQPRPGTPRGAPALPGVGSAFRRPSPKSGARRIVAEVEAVRAASPKAFAPQRLRVVSPKATLRVVSPTTRVASPPPIRVTPVREVGKARPVGRVVSPETINGVPAHKTVEVWFVRHGETVANASRITQGQQPGRLTRTGALQAAALGERLQRDHDVSPFDVVLCSDLLRCRQTCHLATKGFCHEPKVARTDPLLRERAVGVYEGLAHDAPRKPRPPHVPPRKHRVEGGESWDDVNRRARKLLSRLGSTFVSTSKDNSSNDRLRVLCVTHGGFIMEAMNAATGADGCTVPFCSNGAWNTSVWKVELTRNDKGKLCCRVVGANDASHLDNEAPRAGLDLRDDAVLACVGVSADKWWAADEVPSATG